MTVNGVTGANSPIVSSGPRPDPAPGRHHRRARVRPDQASVAPNVCTTNTQAITGWTSGANTAVNEENTEDGIFYQNTIGDPAANVRQVLPPLRGAVTAAAIYFYSAGKFAQQWNDTTDYNSTHNNFVESQLTGSPNTDGNFMAGTLTMATMQNTSNVGEAYVDLTPQMGGFNQDTNRGTLAVDGNTVTEANEWYHHLPSGSNPSDSAASHPRRPLRATTPPTRCCPATTGRR